MKTKRRLLSNHDGRYTDDPVIEDGDPPLRVPMLTCDSNKLLGHRPGWVAPLSEEQIAARQEMIDRQREAWRGQLSPNGTVLSPNGTLDSRRKPDPDDDPDEDDEDQDIADARRFASREAYVARLGDAWRTSPRLLSNHSTRDAAEPDNSSPLDVMRAHLRGSDPDDAQARRDAAAAEYAASISNAWRTPSGATPPARMPRPGSRDPQQLGEQWRGGR
jgi:hypothetical protein